jgi:uncharacterized protein YqjF (DUF2071 family)
MRVASATRRASRARGKNRKGQVPAPIRQRWEHLLFLHWRARADGLAALLPPGLRIDTFEGHAYIGIVPFTVPSNRLRLVPAPLSLPFHEVNLRTYVKGPGGTAGVWFFSLDASSRLVVAGARAVFHLPYRYADIDFSVEELAAPGDRLWINFTSRRTTADAPDCLVRYSPADVPRVAKKGSLEHFLIERYVLYAWTGSSLLSGRVHHEPYPIQEAEIDRLQQRLTDLPGIEAVTGEPLVHYAAGVTVDIPFAAPARTRRSR